MVLINSKIPIKMEDCYDTNGGNFVPRPLVIRLQFLIGNFHSGQFDLRHCSKGLSQI